LYFLKSIIKQISETVKKVLTNWSYLSDAVLPRIQVNHDFVTTLGYTGQYGQDYLLQELLFLLPEKSNYVYVDLGAHDGIQFSNSRFLDSKPGWKGFCIEANPQIFNRLVENRPSATCLNFAISSATEKVKFQINSGYSEMLSGIVNNYSLRHKLRIKNDIKTNSDRSKILYIESKTLNTLFKEHQITEVDILFIDIEGSEFSALSSLDLSRFQVNMIVVERNYSSRGILQMLTQNKFTRLMALGSDDLYVRRELLK
jgi:FkbM family methyltransferase